MLRRILAIGTLVLFLAPSIFSAEKEDDLTKAAREGNVAKMQSIIKKRKGNVDFVKVKNYENYGPLNAAASMGQLEAVKLLVDSGYALDVGLDGPRTYPITLALQRDKYDVVLYLLEKHASVEGLAVAPLLYKGLDDKKKMVVEKMLGAGVHMTPYDVARCANSADFEYLVSSGFNVTEVDANGLNGLHHAAYANNPDVVDLLIRKNVDVNQKDKGGYTPLFYAMVSIGASVQPADLIAEEKYKDKQLTTIHHTSEEPYYTNIRPLVMKQIATVELLLKAGIDVNAQDDKGNTILHLLACTNKATTIEYLLGKGALKDIKNAKGETPAAIAETYSEFLKNSEVVALLK